MGLAWAPSLTVHQLLNSTVKILQKALFEYWQRNKNHDDQNTWTAPVDVELQKWFYDHRSLITSLVPVSEKPYMFCLLQEAVNLRNANAHRHCLNSKEILGFETTAVQLLEVLGDEKGILDVKLANLIFPATKEASNQQLLDSFAADTNWRANARAAVILSQYYRGGYRQFKVDEHLQNMLLRAERKFKEQQLCDYGYTCNFIEEPLRKCGDQISQESHDWALEWSHKMKSIKFVDPSGSGLSEMDDEDSQASDSPSDISFQTGGVLSRWLRRVKKNLSWKQYSALNETELEQDGEDSLSYNTLSQTQESEIPAIDVKAWIQAEAWMRPLASQSEPSITHVDEYDSQDNEDYDHSVTQQEVPAELGETRCTSLDLKLSPGSESKSLDRNNKNPGEEAIVHPYLMDNGICHPWDAEEESKQSSNWWKPIANIGSCILWGTSGRAS